MKSRRKLIGTMWGAATLAFAGLAVSAWAAEKAPQPKVLADFENPAAVRLQPAQATVKLVAGDKGQALQIATEAEADYPGVVIVPRSGKWDLSGYDAVEMEIRNLKDHAVRVLLSVNNPGSDGRKGCNTEAVAIGARGKGRLVVPFGSWHGESGHEIDLTNVVSLHVLLDKPGKAQEFVVDNLRAVLLKTDMSEIFADPFFKQLKPTLGRGINLGNALEAPNEGEWGVRLEESYFDRIKEAGFDNVRIPVRWSNHADKAAPYRVDPKFFERVDWAIKNALERKLYPVVNMHHYEEIFQKPDEHRERFLAIWKQIAERYKDLPSALAFELLNEPHAELTADKWNALLAETIKLIRQTNPTRKIVVGPVDWNAIKALDSLELPKDDQNLIVTVHYYSPFQFTHQGASWTGPEAQKWLGTKWTGTPAEKQAVEADLNKAIAWAVKHRRPIYLGEFGAYSTADMESRARWTRFIADEALKRKMSFAYWEFCSGFGAYDAQSGQWREPLKEALVPKSAK